MTIEIAAGVFVIVVATLCAKHAVGKAYRNLLARREDRSIVAGSKLDRALAARQALNDMADAAHKELARIRGRS